MIILVILLIKKTDKIKTGKMPVFYIKLSKLAFALYVILKR